jgi:hypothetical protein
MSGDGACGPFRLPLRASAAGAGLAGWLGGLVAASGTLQLPPADHPFWREPNAPSQALSAFGEQEEEKATLAARLREVSDAKNATTSAVEWLQAANHKLKDQLEVLAAEAATLRAQATAAAQQSTVTRVTIGPQRTQRENCGAHRDSRCASRGARTPYPTGRYLETRSNLT